MHDPPSDPMPAWHPDPMGLHEHRWWDGTTWTQFVADDGVARPDHPDAPNPGRRRRRPRNQDEWIDLGWKTSGCGCAAIPVVFTLFIAISIVLFLLDGADEPGELSQTTSTVFQVVFGIACIVGFLGGLVGLATLLAIIDRRMQRRG